MLIVGAALMLAGLLLALTVPPLAQAAGVAPNTAFLFPYLLAAFGYYVGSAVVRAIRQPVPRRVQAAVKRAILGLVVLDAILATALAGLGRPGAARCCWCPLISWGGGYIRRDEQTNVEPALTWARFFRQALGLAVIMMSSLGCYLIVLKWRGGEARFAHLHGLGRVVPFPARLGLGLSVALPDWAGGAGHRAGFHFSLVRHAGPRGGWPVPCSSSSWCRLRSPRARRIMAWDTGITATVYENMVAIDEPPANAAPSLHVSLTCLLGLALCRDFPKWWPVTAAGRGPGVAGDAVHAPASFDRRGHGSSAGVPWWRCLWPPRSNGNDEGMTR